ncbi:MAG: DUF4912 domain-containing protein [Fibrobacter sp.]|nr:DUF4912 domain-containing protein [Fibrobacter sp.]
MAATKKTETAEKAVTKKAATAVKKTTTAAKTVKKAATSATVKTLKDAEEKAEKAVAKVKATSATAKAKLAAVKAKVAEAKKSVATKATATKAKAAAKATAEGKTVKTAAAKATSAKKPAAKVTAKAAAKATTKAEEKTEVKVSNDETISAFAQSFDAEYLVLMQKDPNWMHAFWEVSENRIKQAKKGKAKLVLRLFDISSDLTVKRSKKPKFRDVEVPADARSWYVENTAGKSVVAVLGAVQGKNFNPIVESAPVAVFDKAAPAPAADNAFAKASLGGNTLGNFMSSGFSSQTAESWLNTLGGNFGSSSESMFSGALSSAALQAMDLSNIQATKDSVNYGKDFFLWVKTRLIVYGGTRPDAHLQVRGEDFPLNPDGTFSFEEDLPDVTKVIPVFATDKDGDFPTTIVPIVVKRTE